MIKESRVLNSEDLKYYCIWKKEKSDEVKVKKKNFVFVRVFV